MTVLAVAGAVVAIAFGFVVLAAARGRSFWPSVAGLALATGGWSLLVLVLTGAV